MGTTEFSVGSIVWVRRRNGSWWPGKIVGPDELSASHLTSPRSGTPVKLLGREDASVDWYNLEKSKRVKLFRCGDFDDCIKRAESSQGVPIKKREKYARREDAIIHALELEKHQFGKHGKTATTASDSASVVKKGLLPHPESLGNNTVKLGNSKSNPTHKRVVEVSPKTEILDTLACSKMPKGGNQLSGEEDHSESTPRMRGLQDIGLKVTTSKTTLPPFVVSNGSQKSVGDSVEAPLSGGPKSGSLKHTNGKHSLGKRKRSHEELGEESLVKRRDRRRPLVQVLQNSAKLEVPLPTEHGSATVSTSVSGVSEPVGGGICRAKRSRCVYVPADSSESLECKAISPSDIEMSDSQNDPFPHPSSLIEENISGSIEEELDTSEIESTESDCDSSETEDVDEEMAALSDTVPMEPEVSSMGRYEAQEPGSMGREDLDDGDMPHFYGHYPSSAHEAVSKWQLKGKRNIRNLSRRSESSDGKSSIYGAFPDEKGFRGDMIGLGNGYSSSRAVYRARNLVEWADWNWEDHPPSTRECWDIKRERCDDTRHQYRGKPRSLLIDVELQVQATYQKEHVPIVSLMSKLNGKAIIGHPVQIEALEDGSTTNLLSIMDDYGNEPIENDGTTTLPQAWRTARRTANFRVPRPQLSTTLDGDEVAYDFPFLDRENKPLPKKSDFRSFGHKGSLVKRNVLHNFGPPSDRKYKKVPKKVGLSCSQKTRTLSLIAIEHKLCSSNRPMPIHDSIDSQFVEGLMKPGSSGGRHTTVACIPVKLVYSRLLEKINRPPSKAISAGSNGALLNSDLERNPT